MKQHMGENLNLYHVKHQRDYGVGLYADTLKHLLSKSKIRGQLICEMGLYASIYSMPSPECCPLTFVSSLSHIINIIVLLPS